MRTMAYMRANRQETGTLGNPDLAHNLWVARQAAAVQLFG